MPRLPVALLLIAASAPALATGEFYCCPDPATGRRICADTVPPQCRNQGYRIFDKAGNPLRDVPPPMTQEQKEAAAEEARRQRQVEESQRERRRIDQALLDTYATPEDIDLAQQKAEGDISFAIRTAQGKLDEIRKRQRKLANEAEFYKRKPMPPELDRDLRTVAHEMQLQQELIDVKSKELAQIRAKYDVDRKRYFELTGRRTASPAPTR